MKRYKDTPYFITECGKVYRNNKRLRTYYNRGGYEYIKFSICGKIKSHAIHRLVAECYCEGFGGNVVVHHRDGNTKNNHFSNLECITQKQNVHMQDKVGRRNIVECALYHNGEFIKRFESVHDACVFASKKYGVSYSSLNKYRKTKGFCIEKV